MQFKFNGSKTNALDFFKKININNNNKKSNKAKLVLLF